MSMRVALLAAVFWLAGTVAAGEPGDYEILDSVEHNSTYFTQGLERHDDLMFESSGLYGKSKIRKYAADNDQTLLETRIDNTLFAEGLTLFNDELFLLTWKAGTALVFDPETLRLKRKHRYRGEGWGLANNGKQLIMSNGSSTLYFRNPGTFKIEKELPVRYRQQAVPRLNELEFADGHIWANIWLSPLILKIDPVSGEVTQVFYLTPLVEKHQRENRDQVLNGIAYDAARDAYWVTGKNWSERYLVLFTQP